MARHEHLEVNQMRVSLLKYSSFADKLLIIEFLSLAYVMANLTTSETRRETARLSMTITHATSSVDSGYEYALLA